MRGQSSCYDEWSRRCGFPKRQPFFTYNGCLKHLSLGLLNKLNTKFKQKAAIVIKMSGHKRLCNDWIWRYRNPKKAARNPK